MKVGTICYAVESGLGNLAKAFYDNGVIDEALLVRHHHFENKGADWYPGAKVLEPKPALDVTLAMDFCQSCDVMLFFETPFMWSLLSILHSCGVPTALMPMYECYPLVMPHRADLYLCPSDLDAQYFSPARGYPHSARINVPVKVPHRQRCEAKVFVHNAGHGGLRGRNGTKEVVEAWRRVKSEAKLIIRSQEPISLAPYPELLGRATAEIGSVPYSELWDNGGEGDVFLFPEKFNGLSLPLQEAFAAGMLVMATDRFPMNTWLPGSASASGDYKSVLIPVSSTRETCVGPGYQRFTESLVRPEDIAARVDHWYGRDVSSYSELGRAWAAENSWEVLGPKYRDVLAKLARGEVGRPQRAR
jgi:hypothetical protein